jgi:hypothetical protein
MRNKCPDISSAGYAGVKNAVISPRKVMLPHTVEYNRLLQIIMADGALFLKFDFAGSGVAAYCRL